MGAESASLEPVPCLHCRKQRTDWVTSAAPCDQQVWLREWAHIQSFTELDRWVTRPPSMPVNSGPKLVADCLVLSVLALDRYHFYKEGTETAERGPIKPLPVPPGQTQT